MLSAAIPAETASYGEVAKTINGIMKTSQNEEYISSGVERLVKQAGADTTLQNAQRDGVEFAWIPHGDTCAFCIMLASNGWVRASKKTVKGGHAEHIHAHCDCEFAIRFGDDTKYAGYDPSKYKEIYDNAEGGTWEEKLNSMRRDNYARNADTIRAQKKAAYAERNKTLKDVEIKSTISTKKGLSKISQSGQVENPMSVEDYSRIKSRLEDNGIEVFAATTGDDLKYMLAIGAEGTYSDGRITHIGEVPSRGTLLEEIIHATQSRKYGELDETDFVELYAREVEANRKLLKNAKSYGLDELDISDIQRNLENWEQSFEKATGERFDERSYRSKI